MSIEKQTFRINSLNMDYIWRCYHQSPVLHMCRHLISSQLLNNGIQFCYGGCKDRGVEMEAQRELLIEEKWVPFCCEVIDSILCYGFVVVHIGEFPSVLKLGTYWIKVIVEPHGYEWKVYKRASVDEEMENVYVFPVYDPMTDGTINSPVYKVIPRLLFLKRMRESAVNMEQNRAFPTVYSEIKEGQNQSEKEGVDYDFYANAGVAETDMNLRYNRNKNAVGILNQQKDLYDKFLGKKHAAIAHKSLSNVVPLPLGHIMKAPPMNTGRNDLVALHKIIEEEVCATIGVPRSMIISDSGGGFQSGGNNEESIHESFMHTLMFWKKKLGNILSDVYNIIYIEELKKKVNFNQESDAFEAKKKHSVTVFFPVTPFVSNDTLRTLYEQGVISWDKYATYALMNVSLPIEDKEKGPPEIDELLFEKPKEETVDAPKKKSTEQQPAKKKQKVNK